MGQPLPKMCKRLVFLKSPDLVKRVQQHIEGRADGVKFLLIVYRAVWSEAAHSSISVIELPPHHMWT